MGARGQGREGEGTMGARGQGREGEGEGRKERVRARVGGEGESAMRRRGRDGKVHEEKINQHVS